MCSNSWLSEENISVECLSSVLRKLCIQLQLAASHSSANAFLSVLSDLMIHTHKSFSYFGIILLSICKIKRKCKSQSMSVHQLAVISLLSNWQWAESIYLLWYLQKASLWKAVARATYWRFGVDPARKYFSMQCATKSWKTILVVLAVQEWRSMDQ